MACERNYRIEIGLDPRFCRGQALAKARSATSAVDPDGEAIISSHGSAPFRRYPKLAVRGIRGDVRFDRSASRACAPARCWTVSVPENRARSHDAVVVGRI
jgi:hypothetical protein